MTMTLIEGVGDEVTLFFVLALLAVVACLAWWTTRVTDRPLRIQTIIVGQRVIHVDERGEPTAAATAEGEGEQEGAGPEPPPDPAEPEPSCEEDEDGEVEVVQQEERGDEVQEERSSGDGAASEGSREENTAAQEPASQDTASAPTQVEDGREKSSTPAEGGREAAPADPDPAPPSDTAADPATDPVADAASDARQQLRRRRLAFMARQAAEAATQGSPAAPDAADSPRTPSAPSATETPSDSVEQAARDESYDRPAAGTAEETAGAGVAAASGGAQTIMVKLKFLNDTQRLVEGRRAEPLADFKRRHFPTETAANRIVRLIFNGRVLPDQETLSQCGLYHNCVVHCHVSSGPRPAGGAAGGAAAAAGGAAPPELDIGVLLYPVLTSVVTLVWGLRLRYPELFSGTAVLLLAVLTLLLACFAAATFLPLERLPGAAAAAGAAGGRQQQRGR